MSNLWFISWLHCCLTTNGTICPALLGSAWKKFSVLEGIFQHSGPWNHHDLLWLIKTDKQNTQVYSSAQRKCAALVWETCALPRNARLIVTRLSDGCVCNEESIHGASENTWHSLMGTSGMPFGALATDFLTWISNGHCTIPCTVTGSIWTMKPTYQPARLMYLCVYTL